MDQPVNNEPFVNPWPSDPDLSAAQLELWNAEIQWIALCGQINAQHGIVSSDSVPLQHTVELP